MKNNRIIFNLVLSVLTAAVFVADSWGGGSITVEKVASHCLCNETGDAGYNCSIEGAITDAASYDTIYVKPASVSDCGYYNPITVTRAITLVGLTSSGQKAWTAGTAGASSGAPKIRYNSPHKSLAKILHDNVQIAGLSFIGREVSAITCTSIGSQVLPTVNYITLSYNSFDLGTSELNAVDKGVAIDYGAAANNLSMSYCKFTGQTTNTSQWFFIGDNGAGGSVNGVDIVNNSLTNVMSTLQLNNSIKNIELSNNTFSNSWDITDADSRISEPYGYILIEEPSDDAVNIIQGITLTHNTFNNSTGTAPKEFGFLIDDNVEESDAGGDWESNFALHFNNFLQTDTGNPIYPVVGFISSTYFTTDVTATGNWWGATTGPRDFESDSGSGTASDLTNNFGYHPWARAKTSGGAYAELDATTAVQKITGTEMLNSSMSMEVKTENAAATFIPTKYTGNPTGTSLSGALSYYNLGLKSGNENIGAITATFYAPSGSTLGTYPLYWYNGSSWVKVASYALTTASARNILSPSVSFPTVTYYITHTLGPAVTAIITKTAVSYVTPTSIAYITSTTMNSRITQTFFAVVGSSSSGGSSSSSSSSTTTTSSSSSGSSTSSSTTSSITTTSSSSSSTSTSKSSTTTTASSGSTTTVPAGDPQLGINTASLDFGDNQSAKQIVISNTGTGSLDWSILDNETVYNEGSGWIFSVVPRAGSVEATPESVTVTVSRKGLANDTYTARLPVISNGGSSDVDVSMEVTSPEFPIMRVSSQVVLFMTKDLTEKTLSIANIGTGTLTWEFDDPLYHKSEGWITVSPSSGYTEKGNPSNVTITVSRDAVGPGLYSATLPLRSNGSNGGNKNLTVIMLVQEGPVLKVSPSMLLFLDKDVSEGKIVITNGKTGTLIWETGSPVYTKGDGWITSIAPVSGETTTEEDEVLITVSREGLSSGIYMARIPVTSNGGNKKVIVFLFVPFI